VIAAAEITDADAIHPGYGFLAESAHFAEVCDACKIRFIGPSPNVIRLMGDKAKARESAAAAGVPVLPGSRGPVQNDQEAARVAARIGYPVIVKASAGGGGRGMRIVNAADQLAPALSAARTEAQAAFGVPDVYLEKYLRNPRHIEFQVLGDSFGNVVHLASASARSSGGTRRSSRSRPRRRCTEIAAPHGGRGLKVARSVGYQNAGTLEFLLDEEGRFYFMEMNTRIQVEHPVTEMVTGIDLIKEQIKIAAGESLGFRQEDIVHTGHSIECRINAEDPRPSSRRRG